MKINPSYPYYLANRPITQSSDWLEVTDKFSGEIISKVAMANGHTVENAIHACETAAPAMRHMKAYERQAVLNHCVGRITERAEELAQLLTIEVGKPIKDARGEVARTIATLRSASEESVRIYGEVLPLDVTPRAGHYSGMWKRVPIGPCLFITAFNFPLLLNAHKIGPALACGCPFILKPAPDTPLSAIVLGEILAETDLPEGAFSIFPCTNEIAEPIVTDDRIKLLSFTGSNSVGWMLKSKAGKKKVILEMGGNAGCIVDRDWEIDDAVDRILIGGFYQSGQTCISVQRVLVHNDIYESFRDYLVTKVRALKAGNPHEENTFIGPMISEREASRLELWMEEAKKTTAEFLCGGNRDGLIVEPTVIENLPRDAALWCNEAFGPVVVLERFTDFNEALTIVNDSRFGLQAGVFTRDLYHAQKAWDELEVGGVIIGDVPSWRVDHMPYGGVKDSGFGREGLRFAIEDMTERRLMVVRHIEDNK